MLIMTSAMRMLMGAYRRLFAGAAMLALVLLSACSTRQGIAPVPVEDRSVSQAATGQIDGEIPGGEAARDTTTKPAELPARGVTLALLDEARGEVHGGNNQTAAAILERALRLDARNPVLWHELGLIRLRQKNWQQALNLARKSNSLAVGNTDVQAENWRLMARAYQGAGKNQDAAMAWKMFKRLSKEQ